MNLLVGLGNPGLSYQHHRHNIGFMAIDSIASHYNFSPFRAKFQGHVAEARINDSKVILLKPATYMNESGQSVQKAMKFYKLTPEQILVFHDELDLQSQKIRVKKGGGAAGHNGLRSIDSCISPEYWRIRIGIGHPGHRDLVHDYVLQDIPKTDRAAFDKVCDNIADKLPLLLAKDPDKFMTGLCNGI